MNDTREVKLEPTADEIERVAKAQCTVFWGDDTYWDGFRVSARAAILAMDRRASPPAAEAPGQEPVADVGLRAVMKSVADRVHASPEMKLLRAALVSATTKQEPVPVCEVLTMHTSSGFPDHFARVTVGDRSLDFFMSRIKGQAEYHAAELDWLLNGAEKPDILGFDYTEPPGLADYLAARATPPTYADAEAKVAVAICEAEWGRNSWSLVSNHSRCKAARHAQAALAAIRSLASPAQMGEGQ